MKSEEEKDEQLIRWLEGELSGQELSAFEESGEFDDYKKIIDEADGLSFPTMDEDVVFSNIKKKIAQGNSKGKKNGKVIPLRRWSIAIASVAILALAVWSVLPGSINVSAGIGQFVSHTLPDGSEIKLNGNSVVDYKEGFEKNRNLYLEGEAFFEVKKGKTFAVETDMGVVKVLGTSFNVFARNDIFVVSCKTGKVEVSTKNQSYILQKGDRVKVENNKAHGKDTIDINKIGSWVDGESYFSESTLEEVVLSLSSIYESEIELPEVYKLKRFTGSFVHNDYKKALKMVFSPMEISYQVDEKGKVVFD